MGGIRKSIVAMLVSALAAVLASGGAATPSTARLEAERLFVDAQKALAVGDDATAETLLLKSLQRDETFVSALWQLAQINEKRGRLEAARELMIRGLQREGDAAWAKEKLVRLETALAGRLLAEAESLMNSQRYDLAVPKLSLCMGIRPYDPRPLVRMARCHMALGNLESAREYLIQATDRDPAHAEAGALLGELERRLARAAAPPGDPAQPADRASPRHDHTAAGHTAPGSADMEPVSHAARETAGGERGTPPPPAAARDTSEKALPAVTIALLAATAILLATTIFLSFKARGGTDRARRKTSRREGEHEQLAGRTAALPLSDIVVLLADNMRSGRLSVTSSGMQGEIDFDRGEVVHARWGEREGDEGFRRMMELREGSYSFGGDRPLSERTISDPLSLLLLPLPRRGEALGGGARTVREAAEPDAIFLR